MVQRHAKPKAISAKRKESTRLLSPCPHLSEPRERGAWRWSAACAETCGVPRIRDLSLVAGDLDCGGAGVAYFSNFKRLDKQGPRLWLQLCSVLALGLRTPGGFRCSSALPLHEVRYQRPNLHILCNAEAGQAPRESLACSWLGVGQNQKPWGG